MPEQSKNKGLRAQTPPPSLLTMAWLMLFFLSPEHLWFPHF